MVGARWPEMAHRNHCTLIECTVPHVADSLAHACTPCTADSIWNLAIKCTDLVEVGVKRAQNHRLNAHQHLCRACDDNEAK